MKYKCPCCGYTHLTIVQTEITIFVPYVLGRTTLYNWKMKTFGAVQIMSLLCRRGKTLPNLAQANLKC